MINLLKINEKEISDEVKQFCSDFIESNDIPKFLFGRNIYANDILNQIEITAFIDDFYDEKTYLNKSVIKLADAPKNALVLVLSGGNTKTAINRVKEFNLKCLDYFSFYKYSGLELKEIVMNEGFREEFDKNKKEFEWIYSLLEDEISKIQFKNLVNFRYTYEIDNLSSFQNLEDKQYFEEFLNLQEGEVFLDVGGFDGFTSEEFIKLCPKYKEVHIFEPELKNLKLAKKRLEKYSNIFFYDIGLSNKKETLTFDTSGSSSKISDFGEIEIKVDRLDDIIKKKEVSFFKIDIEGAESLALEGSLNTILNSHPKIAISVYHKSSDFWKIPSQILEIRNDYKIYLRHYTESIYETVMFFIPIEDNS